LMSMFLYSLWNWCCTLFACVNLFDKGVMRDVIYVVCQIVNH
jgi:hypothetical protein